MISDSMDSLVRMAFLMEALGHPEDQLRVLHVAGTNGKGSVCQFLYDSLLAMGHTAGLFISPYVLDFRERIQANGEWIPETDLERLKDKVILAADGCLRETGEPLTEFEIVTAIGLMYFAEHDLDFVVIEVGLGGRVDSTNIVKKPLASIITSISYDHMEQLGNTLEEIASEKAGIIKQGCPVVTAVSVASEPAAQGAAQVIARRANEHGSPLIDSSQVFAGTKIHSAGLRGSRFSAAIGERRYDNIEITMPGVHQVQNAVTALCALDALTQRGKIAFDSAMLRTGMKRAVMPARFQVFAGEPQKSASEYPPGTPLPKPVHIYDGAHNEAGVRVLTETLSAFCQGKRILFIVGILRDKNADAMLRIFVDAAGADGSFLATTLNHPRALPAEEIAEKIRAAGGQIASEDVGSDIVVYTGSLYLMGDLLKRWL